MHELLDLLKQWDTPGLECDGQTRVFSTVLHERGIAHTCMFGKLTYHGEDLPTVHFWIELPDGVRVDFRAQMWLGDHQDVPHGIFKKADYPNVVYTGMSVNLEPLSPAVFKFLTSSENWSFPE